jgi:predicted secreted Zn-dependent protease
MNTQKRTIHKTTSAAIREAEGCVQMRESGIADARSEIIKCRKQREEATREIGSIMGELEAQRQKMHDMTEHYEGKISAINDLISNFSKTVVYRSGHHSK